MKIFMSWSGERSKAIAEEFKSFLSKVLQQTQSFISSQDIDLGSIWQNTVLKEVNERRFGLIFITPENKLSEWLHYEAGGLIKDLIKDRVVPILFGLNKKDISTPFSHFQMIEFEKESVFKLIQQINSVTENPLETDSLKEVFDAFFTKTEERIIDVISKSPKEVNPRSSEDILTELLLISREQANNNAEILKILDQKRNFNLNSGVRSKNEKINYLNNLIDSVSQNLAIMIKDGVSEKKIMEYIDALPEDGVKMILYEYFNLKNQGSDNGGI